MGIFLIFAILLVIAILSTVFLFMASEEKAYTIEYIKREGNWGSTKKCTLKSKFWGFWYNIQGDLSAILTVGLSIIFGLACIGLSIGAIVVTARQNIKYEQFKYQYIILTERLEEDNNNYHLFYEDICNYNNAILEDRYWADNLWVNWYHNGKIKDLPLIGE